MKRAIITALRLSEGKPVKRSQLLTYLRNNGYIACTDRAMRREVKEINKTGFECIGSDTGGYFIIANGEQRERYKTAIKKKIFGLWRAFKEADTAYAKKFGGMQTSINEIIEEIEIENKIIA